MKFSDLNELRQNYLKEIAILLKSLRKHNKLPDWTKAWDISDIVLSQDTEIGNIFEENPLVMGFGDRRIEGLEIARNYIIERATNLLKKEFIELEIAKTVGAINHCPPRYYQAYAIGLYLDEIINGDRNEFVRRIDELEVAAEAEFYKDSFFKGSKFSTYMIKLRKLRAEKQK